MIANEVDRLPEKSEHETQTKIVSLIRERQGVATRVNSGTAVFKRDGATNVIRGADKGTSDVIALYKGVYLAIEVKHGKNNATPEQIEFLESVARAGGVGLLAYDSEFVDMALVNIDYGGVEEVRGLGCGIWEPNRIFIREAK